MNTHYRLLIGLALGLILVAVPAAAIMRAEEPAKPMQSHDFVDVPVAGKEFMEPYINAFYHQGITGGCSESPLMYCPENDVTRGSLAVFMGRALGYVDAVNDGFDTRAYFKNTGTGIGVAGSSQNSFGVYATSSTNSAILAYAAIGGSTSDTIFDVDLAGVGEIGTSNGPIYIETSADAAIFLDQNNNGNHTFTVRSGASGQPIVFTVTEAGAMTATGTKSAVVETEDYGERLLYAVESSEVWFEEAGRGQLVDGAVVISIDAMFAQTVNLDDDYEVFLTPIGAWAELYVTDLTATSFTVRAADGVSDIQFSYRIMAKRLGYEDTYMEQPAD